MFKMEFVFRANIHNDWVMGVTNSCCLNRSASNNKHNAFCSCTNNLFHISQSDSYTCFKQKYICLWPWLIKITRFLMHFHSAQSVIDRCIDPQRSFVTVMWHIFIYCLSLIQPSHCWQYRLSFKTDTVPIVWNGRV